MTFFGVFLLSEGAPTIIYRDYMECFILRYAQKEHESRKAELLHSRISTRQELIQQEAPSNAVKRGKVSKQTRQKIPKPSVDLPSYGSDVEQPFRDHMRLKSYRKSRIWPPKMNKKIYKKTLNGK